MFIAHLGVGLAAKRVAPQLSLGVLLLAAQWLDVVCGTLMMTGIEKMRVVHGITAVVPFEFLYYPWSHSLFMSLVWSVALGLTVTLLLGGRRSGILIGTLVISHWLLDFVSHRPDLPLFFGDSPLVGLGLWNYPGWTLAVELALFGVGLAFYISRTSSSDTTGTLSLVGFVGFFLIVFFMNHFGPTPPEDAPQQVLAIPTVAFIILLPWGNWIDRHRKTSPSLSNNRKLLED